MVGLLLLCEELPEEPMRALLTGRPALLMLISSISVARSASRALRMIGGHHQVDKLETELDAPSAKESRDSAQDFYPSPGGTRALLPWPTIARTVCHRRAGRRAVAALALESR